MQDQELKTMEDQEFAEEDFDEEEGEEQFEEEEEEGEEEEEEEAASPPPAPQRPVRRPPPRASLNSPIGQAARASMSSPIEQLAPEQPMSTLPSWGDGPSPLETMGAAQDSAYLNVDRLEANGPSNGYEDGSDYVGHCGHVLHRREFQTEIRRRWGGGKYRAQASVNGKVVERPVVIGGPSKDPEEQEESVEESATGYGGAYTDPYAAYGVSGYGAPPGYPAAVPPGYPAATPYGTAGYPRDPYAAAGYGYDPYGGGAGATARAYGGAAAAGVESEQTKELRAQLDHFREEAARAREDAKISEVQRQADQREQELKRHLDALQADVRSMRDNKGGGLAELMEVQLKQSEAKANEERMERARKWEEELALRREEREREATKRQEDNERYERQRKDRLDREERERRDREEARKEEAARAERERARQDKHMDRMMEMMTAGQQKPGDMIDMLLKTKKLTGGDGTDPVEQILKITDAMSAIKAAATGEGEETGLDKAQKFISSVGESITPAIGELAQIWKKTPAPQAAPAPQEQVQQQYPALPGPQPHEQLGVPAAQAPYAAQATAQEATQNVSPDQWGKILAFAVDAIQTGSEPAETAEHLFTFIKAIEALPAIPQLAETNAESLKSRVRLVNVMIPHSSPVKVKVAQFISILETPAGVSWVELLLEQVRNFWNAIQRKIAQAQRDAAQAPAPVEESREEPRVIVPPPPAVPRAVPPEPGLSEEPDGGETEE